jgi:hypothetical protein
MPSGISILSKVLVTSSLALFVSLIVGLFGRTAAFGDYELWGYDFLVNHATHRSLHSDVVIIDFDDATFDYINQYPIPRSLITSQAQNFEFSLFDEKQNLLYKAHVSGREFRYPDSAPPLPTEGFGLTQFKFCLI